MERLHSSESKRTARCCPSGKLAFNLHNAGSGKVAFNEVHRNAGRGADDAAVGGLATVINASKQEPSVDTNASPDSRRAMALPSIWNSWPLTTNAAQ